MGSFPNPSPPSSFSGTSCYHTQRQQFTLGPVQSSSSYPHLYLGILRVPPAPLAVLRGPAKVPTLNPEKCPLAGPPLDVGTLSCPSLHPTSWPQGPLSAFQEVGRPAGPGQHQEGDDRAGLRDATLPPLLPQVESRAAVHAGHGDTFHFQVSCPPYSPSVGCPDLCPQSPRGAHALCTCLVLYVCLSMYICLSLSV